MGATEKASGWKVRYFVIDKRDKVIRYFEQREKAVRSQNNSLKQLPLTSDTVLTALKEPYLGKDFVFKVVLPGDSRQWLFSVADEAERQSWLDALQSVVGLDAAALLVLAQKAKQNLRHQRSQTMLDSQLMSPLRSDSDTLGASCRFFASVFRAAISSCWSERSSLAPIVRCGAPLCLVFVPPWCPCTSFVLSLSRCHPSVLSTGSLGFRPIHPHRRPQLHPLSF